MSGASEWPVLMSRLPLYVNVLSNSILCYVSPFFQKDKFIYGGILEYWQKATQENKEEEEIGNFLVYTLIIEPLQ